MAGPWEQYQAPEAKPDVAPADTGPWTAYAPKQAGPDVAVTPGEKQFAEDKRLTEKEAGFVPDAIKTAAYSGANTALLNAPTHAFAAYKAYTEDKPYEEAFKEQKAYEEALERQHPTASTVGTGLGIGASFLIPMGEIGLAGRALEAGTAAKLAGTAVPETVAKIASKGAGLLPAAGTAGAMTGVSSALENPVTQIDTGKALKDAAIGAGIGAGAELALPALTKYFSKFPDAIDPATGALTKEAEDVVKKTFPNMEPETIRSFQDQIAKSFGRSGATPEAAKEALALKEGLEPTRSMVTGERPKPAGADIAEKAAIQGEENLTQKVATMAGTPPASPYAAAEGLHGAERKALEDYQTLRNTISTEPGVFEPEAAKLFVPEIEKSLIASNFRTSFEGTDRFPQAAAARKFLDEGIGVGNLPDANKPFNIDNLEEVRKELGNYWAKAKSADRAAMSAMIDGFDNALDKAVQSKLFSEDGDKIVQSLKDSRSLWRDYKSKFYDKADPNGANFRRAVNALIDDQAQKISSNLPQGSAKAAQGIINTGMLDAKTGLAMYNRFERAVGTGTPAMKAVNDQIRNSVLTSSAGFAKLPDKINGFLSQNPEIAKRVFSDKERADLRRLSESINMVAKSNLPNEQKESKIINAIQRLGSLVGAIAMWNIHGSPLAGAATYVAGEAGRAGLEAAKTGYQRGVERRGAKPSFLEKAPEAARVLEGPIQPNAPIRNIEPMLESDDIKPGYRSPTPLGGYRPGRKAGGRVSDKLVAAVDRAKKNINNDTKELLNADDTHVAKALEVANQHIEG